MRGDQYVTLVVQVPEKLNAAQREALLAFDAAMGGTTEKEPETDEGADTKEEKKEEKGKKKKSLKDIFS